MNRERAEARVQRLERHLNTARIVLENIVAREDWRLERGTLVKDRQGREGLVTMVTFPNGTAARPWVWMQRRRAGGRWTEKDYCVTDKWDHADAQVSDNGVG